MCSSSFIQYITIPCGYQLFTWFHVQLQFYTIYYNTLRLPALHLVPCAAPVLYNILQYLAVTSSSPGSMCSSSFIQYITIPCGYQLFTWFHVQLQFYTIYYNTLRLPALHLVPCAAPVLYNILQYLAVTSSSPGSMCSSSFIQYITIPCGYQLFTWFHVQLQFYTIYYNTLRLPALHLVPCAAPVLYNILQYLAVTSSSPGSMCSSSFIQYITIPCGYQLFTWFHVQLQFYTIYYNTLRLPALHLVPCAAPVLYNILQYLAVTSSSPGSMCSSSFIQYITIPCGYQLFTWFHVQLQFYTIYYNTLRLPALHLVPCAAPVLYNILQYLAVTSSSPGSMCSSSFIQYITIPCGYQLFTWFHVQLQFYTIYYNTLRLPALHLVPCAAPVLYNILQYLAVTSSSPGSMCSSSFIQYITIPCGYQLFTWFHVQLQFYTIYYNTLRLPALHLVPCAAPVLYNILQYLAVTSSSPGSMCSSSFIQYITIPCGYQLFTWFHVQLQFYTIYYNTLRLPALHLVPCAAPVLYNILQYLAVTSSSPGSMCSSSFIQYITIPCGYQLFTWFHVQLQFYTIYYNTLRLPALHLVPCAAPVLYNILQYLAVTSSSPGSMCSSSFIQYITIPCGYQLFTWFHVQLQFYTIYYNTLRLPALHLVPCAAPVLYNILQYLAVTSSSPGSMCSSSFIQYITIPCGYQLFTWFHVQLQFYTIYYNTLRLPALHLVPCAAPVLYNILQYLAVTSSSPGSMCSSSFIQYITIPCGYQLFTWFHVQLQFYTIYYNTLRLPALHLVPCAAPVLYNILQYLAVTSSSPGSMCSSSFIQYITIPCGYQLFTWFHVQLHVSRVCHVCVTCDREVWRSFSQHYTVRTVSTHLRL